MKTRSNMPLFVVETDNVKALSNSQIDLLRCGDYLVKKDATGEHAYKVTFKSNTGMCITYMDAYCVETQSYDKVDGNWVYNSEDKTIIAEPSLENIVDAQGHKRFIGGEIDLPETTGITKEYGKWSLSGTHLLIVLVLNVANAVVITDNQVVGQVKELPDWIKDKIYPVFGTRIIRKIETLYASDGSIQTCSMNLIKQGTEILISTNTQPLTLNADRKVRVAYDLLIDND